MTVLNLQFPAQEYRKTETRPGLTISHMYPLISDWPARRLPDKINPRSHDGAPLKGKLRRSIAATVIENPSLFEMANRGIAVIAKNCVYDHKSGLVTITISDDATQGVFDGGTTDAVLAGCKCAPEYESYLSRARVHVEVIVCDNLSDEERLKIAGDRNTSVQVKSWSLADLGGNFNWIKETLASSPIGQQIGYEENEEKPTDVREVLALLTLFHADIRPTQAYSARGVLDKKMTNPKWVDGYKVLEPLLTDIIELHDYAYSTFPLRYREAFPGGKLGRRGVKEDRYFTPRQHSLPFTGLRADYTIPTGVLYPLLASLKALIDYDMDGKARFSTSPKRFLDRFGAKLVEDLIGHLGNHSPTVLGKQSMVYSSLLAVVRAEHAEKQLRERVAA